MRVKNKNISVGPATSCAAETVTGTAKPAKTNGAPRPGLKSRNRSPHTGQTETRACTCADGTAARPGAAHACLCRAGAGRGRGQGTQPLKAPSTAGGQRTGL